MCVFEIGERSFVFYSGGRGAKESWRVGGTLSGLSRCAEQGIRNRTKAKTRATAEEAPDNNAREELLSVANGLTEERAGTEDCQRTSSPLLSYRPGPPHHPPNGTRGKGLWHRRIWHYLTSCPETSEGWLCGWARGRPGIRVGDQNNTKTTLVLAHTCRGEEGEEAGEGGR